MPKIHTISSKNIQTHAEMLLTPEMMDEIGYHDDIDPDILIVRLMHEYSKLYNKLGKEPQ